MRPFLPLALLCASALMNSGCVPFAAAGAGTAGVTVAQERSVGQAVDDTGIKLTIINKFAQQETKDLLVHVDVKVVEGRVLLAGNVKTPDLTVKAVELAWMAEGVKEVINEIQVEDKSGLADYARDTWISTQIESRLLLTKGIRSINYNIETVNGVVYVIGLAQDQFELNSVMLIARTTRYVQQVISHVRLKSDPLRKTK